jgi:hypothetical protein
LKGEGQDEHFVCSRARRAVRDAAERAGRTLSEWLAEAGSTDGIDATVTSPAGPGDRLYTSDPDDSRKLCGAGNNAAVIGCY